MKLRDSIAIVQGYALLGLYHALRAIFYGWCFARLQAKRNPDFALAAIVVAAGIILIWSV